MNIKALKNTFNHCDCNHKIIFVDVLFCIKPITLNIILCKEFYQF